MREYNLNDGVLMCDNKPMTMEEIKARLEAFETVISIVYNSPELNMCNYSHDQVHELNSAMCEAWTIINEDFKEGEQP